MATTLTRAEAVAALAERSAERDRIQANLLDLDGSFGKRFLAGAKLSGVTQPQWESAAADLASIWDAFTAYSGVVQRATEILDGSRWPSGPQLTTLTNLLTGDSVALVGQDVPLARRQLTGSGRPEEHVTLDVAVHRMTPLFSRVNDVVSAAENVWTEVNGRLDEMSAVLGPASQQTAALGDDGVRDKVGAIEADLRNVRDLLNSDPLSLWLGDRVAVRGLDQLVQRARSVASEVAELTRLRQDADRRIAEVADQVKAAQACEQDALKQLEQAEQKISADLLPPMPPETSSLAQRLADLDAFRAAGRLQRLATEIADIERDAAAAAKRWQDTEVAARALLDRRTELRGLLDAYQAKAGSLGAAEDPELARLLQVARDLLWSAPCDLAASAEAVRSYQQAVLAIQRGTP